MWHDLMTNKEARKKIARFIVGLVNDNQKQHPLLDNVQAVLEGVNEEGLTFTTEQAVEYVVTEMRKRRRLEGAADSVLDRMASAIEETIQSSGDCKRHELRSLGFSPGEIALHWPMAYALACVSLDIEPSDS
jgi:hypothetical protein